MRIDIHAHYWPTNYINLLERLGSKATGAAQKPLASDKPADLDARFKMMDEAGVDIQILSVASVMPYFQQRDAAVEAAQLINNAYAEIARRYPDRFRAFAALPLPHIDHALAEMRRCLDELGMVGVTIATTVLDKPLTDPRFEPFFAELDRRGTALFIHPSDEFGLNWLIGASFEDTYVALQLILSGFSTRHPQIKIIIPHLGGTLPFLMSRIDHLYEDSWHSGQLVEKPSALACRMWYDTVSHGNMPALRNACEILGADRFILGSDYPYQVGNWYTNAVTHVAESCLPADDVDAILDRTAATLFGLS